MITKYKDTIKIIRMQYTKPRKRASSSSGGILCDIAYEHFYCIGSKKKKNEVDKT